MAPALTATVSGPDSASPVAAALAPAPTIGIDSGLLHLKTRPAPLRPGLVPRERLVRRLLDARRVAVALIVAPAGYGKTTLLAQWSERDERPFAWVSLDEDDNDPRNLVYAIALALEAVDPVGWEVFEPLSSGRPDAAETAVRRLAKVLGCRERPLVLVLDDAHVLRTRETRRVLATLSRAFGGGLQLTIAARREPVLAMGRLRAHGRSVELRSDDLAMTRSEASMLLNLAGVELTPQQALLLARRTEGWPAGLQLAALSLREQDQADPEEFAGDDRFVAEYVREELLSELSAPQLEFLRSTSILERLSAPLCDQVTGRIDSAEMLAGLARANVLMAPLDRSDSSYRYNELFAATLRAELRRVDPVRYAELHRRASDWCARHGETARAIAHAVDAHDVERAGRLLWDGALQHGASGQQRMIWGWLDRFTDDERAESPLLALVAAGTSLAAGNVYEAERWTAVAAGGSDDTQIVRAGVALIRAAIGSGGGIEMVSNASLAFELLDEASPWRSLCGFLNGVALQLGGDREQAERWLREGAHRAATAAPLVQTLCLAQLALLAADEGDLDRAMTLADRATAQVKRCGLEECPTAALPLAVSAELRAQRRQVEQATDELTQARALLGAITDPPAWYGAECRVLLARTTLKLTGPQPAAELLATADRAANRALEAPVLREWVDEATAQVDLAMSHTRDVDWSLTAAELRVLRFLPSHLPLREIAERLYVSPNTVKTHARGIYRKLGASSRGEAVDRAREAGLVDTGAGQTW